MFPSFDSAWSTIDSIDLSSLTDDLTPKKQQKPQQQQTSFAPTVTFSPPPKMMMDDLFSSPPPPPPPSAASASTALKTGAEHAPLHFTEVNKMSLFSLEKRIDYHLSRIMKGHRLINFKNSIERLSTEKRICECILEVLVSSDDVAYFLQPVFNSFPSRLSSDVFQEPDFPQGKDHPRVKGDGGVHGADGRSGAGRPQAAGHLRRKLRAAAAGLWRLLPPVPGEAGRGEDAGHRSGADSLGAELEQGAHQVHCEGVHGARAVPAFGVQHRPQLDCAAARRHLQGDRRVRAGHWRLPSAARPALWRTYQVLPQPLLTGAKRSRQSEHIQWIHLSFLPFFVPNSTHSPPFSTFDWDFSIIPTIYSSPSYSLTFILPLVLIPTTTFSS